MPVYSITVAANFDHLVKVVVATRSLHYNEALNSLIKK